MRENRIHTRKPVQNGQLSYKHIYRKSFFLSVIVFSVIFTPDVFGVTAAVVSSWGRVPVFTELNNNWQTYGSTPLSIDQSLCNVSSFTYEDLVNTGADILWLSDPAGGAQQYSAQEIEAVRRYTNEGHSILGTYIVFQYAQADNRGLAPIFGLSQDINYNDHEIDADRSFNILGGHDLFRNLSNPYVSSGYPYAQVPSDDLRWDSGDLGSAQLLAQTNDSRGIITWYQTDSYHAIYVSEMVEYYGNSADTQFLYNALTVPEPVTALLLGLGGLMLRKKTAV